MRAILCTSSSSAAKRGTTVLIGGLAGSRSRWGWTGPREFGFTHYSTMLIPEWVNRLTDYARCAEILADAPGTPMPVVAVVDYSAVDSGLNPDGLHLVSAVGVDRVANWDGLDDQAYRAKRDGWLDAIVAGIDRSFPGFAAAVVQREMATAATMRHYLNTPDGAVYGFAQRAMRPRLLDLLHDLAPHFLRHLGFHGLDDRVDLDNHRSDVEALRRRRRPSHNRRS